MTVTVTDTNPEVDPFTVPVTLTRKLDVWATASNQVVWAPVANATNYVLDVSPSLAGTHTISGSSATLATPMTTGVDYTFSVTALSASNATLTVLQGKARFYGYTGAAQTFTVPTRVNALQVTACGARGGDWQPNSTTAGLGGCVDTSLAATPTTTLNLYVGGKGGDICMGPSYWVSTSVPYHCDVIGSSNAGVPGWNGGGWGGLTGSARYGRSGGGGGATDIRIGGTALANRVIVAGGGGGSYQPGGLGGGLEGTKGVDSYGWGGGGGTQTAGGTGGARPGYSGADGGTGTSGTGGNGGSCNTSWCMGGGGGGGGYFGGGGGEAGDATYNNGASGGGGGSSWTSPSSTANVTHRQGAGSNGAGFATIGWPGDVITVDGTTGQSQVTLFWNSPTPSNGTTITGYETRYSADGGITWSTPTATGSTRTLHTVTGLVNGTSHIFQVRATTPTGPNSWSPPSGGIVPFSVPAAPSGLTVYGNASQADITWNAVAASPAAPVDGYRLFVDGEQRCQTASTSCTLNGWAGGTQYAFQVASYNSAGQGPLSESVLWTPPVPLLDVWAVSSNEIAWVPVEGANSYSVGASPSLAGTHTIAGSSATLATPMTPGVDYTFTITALSSSNTTLAVLQGRARFYGYTGAAQTFTVPSQVNALQVVACGARGGNYTPNPTTEGVGGCVETVLSTSPATVLNLYVGGRGGDHCRVTYTAAVAPHCNNVPNFGAGGWNGGGLGGLGGTTYYGGRNGGGGGATDIRIGGTALVNRVIVAGGGGGGGATGRPGHGGGLTGETGGNSFGFGGGGGTQSVGGVGGARAGYVGGDGQAGASGQGGGGGNCPHAWCFGGGGGGGGYFGGGGGESGDSGSNNGGGAGGGGSSWTSPTLTDATMHWVGGGPNGDGAIVLSWGAPPAKVVGVGTAGQIITSDDGINWTTRTSGTANNLNEVVYVNNQYIAVGNSGTILTSPDGITWTSRNSGTTNQLNSATWAGGSINLYVVVGANNTILTSPDLATWTARTSPALSTAYLSKVRFGASLNTLVVTTSGNNNSTANILHSTNGTTWTGQFVNQAGTTYTQTNGVDFAPNLNTFMFGGDAFASRISTNGSTWTTGGSVGTHWLRDAVWLTGPQRWILVQYANYFSYSPVNTSTGSFTTRTLPESTGFNRLAWVPSVNLAIGATGSAGRYYTSPDGVTWTARASNLTTQLNSFAGAPAS